MLFVSSSPMGGSDEDKGCCPYPATERHNLFLLYFAGTVYSWTPTTGNKKISGESSKDACFEYVPGPPLFSIIDPAQAEAGASNCYPTTQPEEELARNLSPIRRGGSLLHMRN